jgi:NADPH:quinone reductase-like Zn-dependent oxidoreductase
MRAIAISEFGGADRLEWTEVDDPLVGPDSVLIRVRAAGINPVDYKIREGNLTGRIPHVLPVIPGWDVAGVVEQVGPAVTEFAPGDEVYAYCRKDFVRDGTYAELAAVRDYAVAPKPAGLSFEEAGGVPLAGLTALQLLRDEMRIAVGERVLIHAAAGGVGSFAVQIAKLLGASVSATASAAKLDYVKSLGADRVYDYRTTTLAQIRERFAVVLDVASTSSFGACASLLEPAGTYVALLPSPSVFLGMGRALFSAKRCKFVVVKPLAGDLDQLRTWLDEGKLRPILDSSYPFAELPAALARMRSGDVRGKLAVTIGGA